MTQIPRYSFKYIVNCSSVALDPVMEGDNCTIFASTNLVSIRSTVTESPILSLAFFLNVTGTLTAETVPDQ